jgi:hypothetical protein
MGFPVRTRLTSIFLLALLSISGETMNAQSSGTAPAEVQKTSSAADLPVAASAKVPNAPDPARRLSALLPIVAKRGQPSHLPAFLSSGLGLPGTTDQLLGASVLDIDGARRVFLVDNMDAAVVMTAVNEQTTVYLVRSGVLKKAAQLKRGRMGSMSLQNIPLASALVGFDAERNLWIQELDAKSAGPRSK